MKSNQFYSKQDSGNALYCNLINHQNLNLQGSKLTLASGKFATRKSCLLPIESGVRSAMRAASQLPGRGPTVVDMAPLPAR